MKEENFSFGLFLFTVKQNKAGHSKPKLLDDARYLQNHHNEFI